MSFLYFFFFQNVLIMVENLVIGAVFRVIKSVRLYHSNYRFFRLLI